MYFQEGCKRFTLCVSSEKGGAVRVATSRVNGEAVCEIAVPAGSNLAEITVDTANVTGEQDLYIAFAGDVTANWWQFAK